MGSQEIKNYTLQDLLQEDGGKASVSSDTDALAFCLDLARSHYENFPVASVLLPRRMRTPVTVVYAFARMGDDIADEGEIPTVERKKAGLTFLRSMAENPAAYPHHPVARALRAMMAQHAIERTPLLRLLTAFERDITFERNTSWDEFLEYCSYSANPVGELVLSIAGDASPESIKASNDICTALQIVNMLQDISVDVARGKHYLPFDTHDPASLEHAFTIVQNLMKSGSDVTRFVRSMRLRTELKLIIAGGKAILSECRQLGTQLNVRRPTVGKFDVLLHMITS